MAREMDRIGSDQNESDRISAVIGTIDASARLLVDDHTAIASFSSLNFGIFSFACSFRMQSVWTNDSTLFFIFPFCSNEQRCCLFPLFQCLKCWPSNLPSNWVAHWHSWHHSWIWWFCWAAKLKFNFDCVQVPAPFACLRCLFVNNVSVLIFNIAHTTCCASFFFLFMELTFKWIFNNFAVGFLAADRVVVAVAVRLGKHHQQALNA